MKKILFAMRDDGDMTEPMNLMLLSALAQRRGWTTDLVVLEHDDVLAAVRRTCPEIVAFSAITGSHQKLVAANDAVKSAMPSVKTVIGGPYATFHPQIIHEHPFDAVGVGECDDAWPELLDAWEHGSGADDISNIVTRENAARVLKKSLTNEGSWSMVAEHLRPRTTNLDDLPFMDRALIYERTAFKNRYKRTMMAGRGCPFRCTYCFEHAWNAMYAGKGKLLARHSVKRLCAELKELKECWDTRFIKFYDDVFPVFDKVDDAWLEEFAETYPREVGLPFHCLVRAELVNEQSERKLSLLKRAGIASLSMSIESGNAFVRDYVLVRDMTDDDLRNSFAICRKLGIHTFANTILGVPAPTKPNLEASKEDYQAQLARIVTVASEVDPRQTRTNQRLTDRIRGLETEISNETGRRLAIGCLLDEVGVRAEQMDYDRESVRRNAEYGVSFGEFPVFFPYAGTRLGAYAVKHGYFDGNYDRLHASYQTQSPLDCFSEAEKREQQNLALLGTVILEFAGSFNPYVHAFTRPATWLATNVLAKLPLTGIYLWVYTACKNDMHARRVYPMRRSLKERAAYFLDNLGLDLFKQRGMAPSGQTLGGPPPR